MATEARVIPGREVFFLHDSKGFPTEDFVAMAYEKGAFIEWPSYVEAAQEAGWKFDKTMDTIYHAMIEGRRPVEWVRHIVILCAKHWNR